MAAQLQANHHFNGDGNGKTSGGPPDASQSNTGDRGGSSLPGSPGRPTPALTPQTTPSPETSSTPITSAPPSDPQATISPSTTPSSSSNGASPSPPLSSTGSILASGSPLPPSQILSSSSGNGTSAPNLSPSASSAALAVASQSTSITNVQSASIYETNAVSSSARSSLTSGSTSSSTPIPAAPTSNTKHNTPVAAIVVPILVLLLIISLGIGYCIYRRRRRKNAVRSSLGSINYPAMDEIAPGAAGTMNGGMVTPDIATANRWPSSEPNPFASPPSSPVQLAYDVPDTYVPSTTTFDLQHSGTVTETSLPSPARFSLASVSQKVPFFSYLNAMRRRSELNETGAIKRGMEYTDIEAGDRSSIYACSVTSLDSSHVSTVYAI